MPVWCLYSMTAATVRMTYWLMMWKCWYYDCYCVLWWCCVWFDILMPLLYDTMMDTTWYCYYYWPYWPLLMMIPVLWPLDIVVITALLWYWYWSIVRWCWCVGDTIAVLLMMTVILLIRGEIDDDIVIGDTMILIYGVVGWGSAVRGWLWLKWWLLFCSLIVVMYDDIVVDYYWLTDTIGLTVEMRCDYRYCYWWVFIDDRVINWWWEIIRLIMMRKQIVERLWCCYCYGDCCYSLRKLLGVTFHWYWCHCYSCDDSIYSVDDDCWYSLCLTTLWRVMLVLLTVLIIPIVIPLEYWSIAILLMTVVIWWQECIVVLTLLIGDDVVVRCDTVMMTITYSVIGDTIDVLTWWWPLLLIMGIYSIMIDGIMILITMTGMVVIPVVDGDVLVIDAIIGITGIMMMPIVHCYDCEWYWWLPVIVWWFGIDSGDYHWSLLMVIPWWCVDHWVLIHWRYWVLIVKALLMPLMIVCRWLLTIWLYGTLMLLLLFVHLLLMINITYWCWWWRVDIVPFYCWYHC